MSIIWIAYVVIATYWVFIAVQDAQLTQFFYQNGRLQLIYVTDYPSFSSIWASIPTQAAHIPKLFTIPCKAMYIVLQFN